MSASTFQHAGQLSGPPGAALLSVGRLRPGAPCRHWGGRDEQEAIIEALEPIMGRDLEEDGRLKLAE
jgi:hypothetical protein